MREIKFRSWSKSGLRFWYFDYTKGFNAENNDLFTEPMQFTGLKDKNGVEIYEGDITKPSIGKLSVIVWNDSDLKSGWSQEFTISKRRIDLGKFDGETLEVIGNIYETPELL